MSLFRICGGDFKKQQVAARKVKQEHTTRVEQKRLKIDLKRGRVK